MGLKRLKYYNMILLCFLISGCFTQQTSFRKKEPLLTFSEQYRQSKKRQEDSEEKDRIQFKRNVDVQKPYVPVMLPPKVIKVWIPSHRSKKDSNMLIGGHWVFVVIKEADWFIDHEIKEERVKIFNTPTIKEKEE